MTTLTDIQAMRQQGASDSDIVQNLREKGVSPFEITQAMEQSNIKAAVSSDENSMLVGQMQPSVMEAQGAPQNQEYPAYSQEPPQVQYQQYPQEQFAYPQMPQYSQTSADNMAEIAEQIAEEKINNFKKKVGNIDEIKIILAKKVDLMDERLKKIEEVIDNIHKAVINKIGSYGDSIEQIRDEMSMMQDSFSKAIPHMTKHTEHHETKQESRHETKQEEKEKKKEERKHHKNDGFEHFLRR